MHILLGTMSPSGHMNPTLRVGSGLLAQGHKVTLLTSRAWIESKSGAEGRFHSEVQGMKLVPLDDGLSDSLELDLKQIQREDGLRLPRNIFKKLCQMIEKSVAGPLEEIHAQEPIDYAVVDYMAAPWMEQLTKMEIDFCVNLPTPSSMMWLFRVQGTEDWSWMMWAMRMEFFLLKNVILSYIIEQSQAFGSGKPWLINAFPEVDKFIPIPAHCKYCGSLGAAPPDAHPSLSTMAPLEGQFGELFKRAGAAKLPVICVSLGSMVRPDAVVIKAIHNALAGGPWFVVWSLYQWGLEQLPEVDNKQFLISKWIPQAAILAHSECKVFITHGGWGGLMEAAATGKPVLCLPFFGDQPTNAQLVEESGWGLALTNQKVSPVEVMKDPPQWTGNLKSEEVRTKLTKILETPSFEEVGQRMKEGALRYGGRSGAAKQVEDWANLSKQGRLPKPVKAPRTNRLGACCAALCG